MAQQLTDAVLTVLRQLNYDHFNVRFPQLDPDLYQEVNELLKRLGGTWTGGRTQAHVFAEDPSPLIQFALDTAVMPPKNPEAFFPSPKKVAHGIMAMAELEKLQPDDLILEPEAGDGALTDYLLENAEEFLQTDDHPPLKPRIHLIERSPLRCAILRKKGYQHVYETDFLTHTSSDLLFARILMNPPFSVPGGSKDLYIKHILHAFNNFLQPRGVLTAIAPDNFIRHTDERSRSFLEFVTNNGYFEPNEPRAFKQVGANVNTVSISLQKPTLAEIHSLENEPHQDYLNYYCFLAHLRLNNEPHLTNRAEALFRQLKNGQLNLDLLGEPDTQTRETIQALYEDAVLELRREGIHIKMQPAWMRWLVSSLMKEHADRLHYETFDNSEVKSQLAA